MRQLKITNQVTSREDSSLDKYLKDISRISLLTAEEEVVLAQRIKTGDKKALEKLVNANLRFVVSVAKQYQNQGLSLPDLINAGNMGLIKSAKVFDETRGFKFISYSVWWIRQSILQALAENARLVRLPLNKIGSISKIKKAVSVLEQQLERNPSHEELAEYLEVSEYEIRQSISVSGMHVSLDAPLADNEDQSMLDVLDSTQETSPDNDLINASLKTEIQRILATLEERESKIICMIFGLFGHQPSTLKEISDEVGLSCERIRQLKKSSIQKLRKSSKASLLHTYLG